MNKRLLILLAILCLMMPAAMADEFSGAALEESWHVIGSSKVNANCVNGMIGFVIPRNEEAFLLRPQREGDWEIDTNLEDMTGLNEKYFHGMALYTDEQNYLIWGRTEGQLALRGMIAGEESTLFTMNDGAALKIRKVTRGADYATYYFYSQKSFSGNPTWLYGGCFEDTDHIFDHLEYGFYGIGSKTNAAVYDYFTESVLDIDVSWFMDGGTVDGVWQTASTEEALVAATGGSLKVTYKGNAITPAILRRPIDQDWRLNTRMDQLGLDHGLLIWKDADHYLLFGPKGGWQVMGGEETQLGQMAGDAGWLRLTKQGGLYTLETSLDGVQYEKALTYQDEGAVFEGARYGVGARNARYQTATYFFFREMRAPNGLIWATAEYRDIGRLIGAAQDNPINDTFSTSRLRAGDEGNLIDAGDKVFMMLGDSFSGNGTHTTDWRSNVLSIIRDDTPQDGLDIAEVFTDEYGIMKEQITAKHDAQEITCIPSHGVYIDGTLYYHFISVHYWGVNGHWDCNHAGMAWSEDEGKTWNRIEDFFPAQSNFMYTSMLRQDGYVYVFGIPSGKYGCLRLARVPEEEILNRSAYTFYAGLDEKDNPVWSTEEKDAAVIVDDQVSEFSVVYNAELDRYLLGYLNQYSVSMVLRDSPTLWGEWSNPVILTDIQSQDFMYGPYMLERYIQEDGTRLYFMGTEMPEYAVTWNSVKLITQE